MTEQQSGKRRVRVCAVVSRGDSHSRHRRHRACPYLITAALAAAFAAALDAVAMLGAMLGAWREREQSDEARECLMRLMKSVCAI